MGVQVTCLTLEGVNEALNLLRSLGASGWLVRHHELVAEAASQLLDGLSPAWLSPRDRATVLLGAALHDAGKILHPEEERAPGRLHERAGRELLLQHGVPAELAAFCESHAAWDERSPLVTLLVALADKLWKGKRVPELEELVVHSLAQRTGRPFWELWPALDELFEAVSAGADDKLARSGS
jgi:hypothetical protein